MSFIKSGTAVCEIPELSEGATRVVARGYPPFFFFTYD